MRGNTRIFGKVRSGGAVHVGSARRGKHLGKERREETRLLRKARRGQARHLGKARLGEVRLLGNERRGEARHLGKARHIGKAMRGEV
jgi:hypothetical protein